MLLIRVNNELTGCLLQTGEVTWWLLQALNNYLCRKECLGE